MFNSSLSSPLVKFPSARRDYGQGDGNESPNVVSLRISVLLLFVAVAAMGLVGFHYLNPHGLWVEEAYLAHNVTERSIPELLQPLDYDLIAPPGYLLLTKVATTFMGTTEFALRLVPFIASLLAILLAAVAFPNLLSGFGSILALVLFAIMHSMTAGASPFALDPVMGLLLVVCCQVYARDPHNTSRALLFGIVGAYAPWASYPSIFMLIGVALWAFAETVQARTLRATMNLLLMYVLWGIGAASCYFLVIKDLWTSGKLSMIWQAGYPPSPTDWSWYAQSALEPFVTGLQLSLPVQQTIVACAIGIVILLLTRPGFGFALLTALATCFAAAALQLVPINEGFLTWTTPWIALTASALIGLLLRVISLVLPEVALIAVTVVSGYLIYINSPRLAVPQSLQEMRPVMAYVREHAEPTDTVYVSHMSTYVFKLYAEKEKFPAGFPLLKSHVDRNVFEQYLSDAKREFNEEGKLPLYIGEVSHFGGEWIHDFARDFETVRGKSRVWIVMAHFKGGLHRGEEMLEYLNAIGRRIDAFEVPGHFGGTAAYLYDLSGGTGGPPSTPTTQTSSIEQAYDEILKLQQEKKYAEAKAAITAFETRDPSYRELQFIKGYVLQMLGEADPSIEAYKAYLVKDSAHYQTNYNVGYAFVNKGECSQAINYFKKALEAKPDSEAAKKLLAKCQAETKK